MHAESHRTRTEHVARAACMLAVLLLCSTRLLASMTTTALTGRVVIGKAPASGVTVTATSDVLQGTRTTITNARGRYWIDALPAGTYEVTFAKPGHTSLTLRAIVELARVARADATLEVSEEEESVSSTVSTLTVSETTAITAHFSSDELRRMPVESTPFGARAIVAQPPISGTSLDGVSLPYVSAIGEEVTDQVALTYAAAPADTDRSRGSLISAQTRRGSEELSITLRDTLSNSSGLRNLFDSAVSGHVLPEKLWFFASAWHGDDAWRHVDDLRGFALRLTSQLGQSHNVDASYLDGDARDFFYGGTSVAAVRYTGIFGNATSVQAVVSRASVPFYTPGSGIHSDDDALSLRASRTMGDHVLSAGTTLWNDSTSDPRALFVNDRWSIDRWTVNAGLRHERNSFDARTSPRAAVSYDLQGNGRRAFFASWGEYASDPVASPLRVATVGFATAIGRSGSARIDGIRSDDSYTTRDEIRLAAQYRLFDRFEAGGTYAYGDLQSAVLAAVPPPRHDATAWLSAEVPLGEQELGLTVLQHYVSGRIAEASTTDVALRYTVPFARFRLTLASDATNVWGSSRTATPRALRFWIRARI